MKYSDFNFEDKFGFAVKYTKFNSFLIKFLLILFWTVKIARFYHFKLKYFEKNLNTFLENVKFKTQ